MKKILIASGVAVMAFAMVAGAQSVVFTSNLTVGSTGPQVVALQNALKAAGFNIPAIASGAAQPGYFGSQTAAAVKLYQASKGIPNTGFVGPLTRAALNGAPSTGTPVTTACPAGMICTPVGGGTPVVSTVGAEGQLTNFDLVGSVSNESVDEGANDAKVLGVEVEAEDSDMVVERVDVDFTAPASGSDNLDDYIDSVSLWMGSTKLATLDVARADDSTNDVFSFRFTGLKAIVKKGDTSSFYVAVNAVNNVDSNDTGDWTVEIPENGIRAVDGAGISDTYVGSSDNLSETFSVGAAAAGELDVTENSASPAAGIKAADEDNDTSDVTLMIMDLEADESNITVDEIPVGFVATGANVNQIVKTVKLVKGSTVLDSKSVPTSGTSWQVVFDNLGLDIEEGDTATLKVVADVNDFEGAFGPGDSVYATTTGSSAAWDVEDASGDAVTPSGDVTGEAQSFFSDAIAVSLTSKPTATSDNGLGIFLIPFSVKATDSAIYISDTQPDRIATNATPSGVDTGVQYATTSTSGTGTIVLADLQGTINTGDVSGSYFKIEKGATRNFTLRVEIANAATTFTTDSVMLKSVNWSTTTASASFVNHYTYDLGSFLTDTLTWRTNP